IRTGTIHRTQVDAAKKLRRSGALEVGEFNAKVPLGTTLLEHRTVSAFGPATLQALSLSLATTDISGTGRAMGNWPPRDGPVQRWVRRVFIAMGILRPRVSMAG